VAVTFGFLNKPEGKNFTLTGPEVRDDKLFSIGSSYGLRKGDDHIKKLLNDGLAKIIADGTWEKIKTQYFGPLDISVHQEKAK
jgi:lysine/arginine/ornithine transport system substrate-binding protein